MPHTRTHTQTVIWHIHVHAHTCARTGVFWPPPMLGVPFSGQAGAPAAGAGAAVPVDSKTIQRGLGVCSGCSSSGVRLRVREQLCLDLKEI